MKTKTRRSKRLKNKQKAKSLTKSSTRKSKRIIQKARDEHWKKFWKNSKSYEEERRMNQLDAVFLVSNTVSMATTIYSELDEKSLTQRFIDTINEEIEKVNKGGDGVSIARLLASVGSKKRGTRITRESSLDGQEEYKIIR